MGETYHVEKFATLQAEYMHKASDVEVLEELDVLAPRMLLVLRRVLLLVRHVSPELQSEDGGREKREPRSVRAESNAESGREG